MTSQFAIASREFPVIIQNVKVLGQQLHSVDGTLGAFGLEHGGVELTRARVGAARLGASIRQPSGTIGLALSSRSRLTDRANRALARADSLRALVSSSQTALGRFRRDSTLMREVADMRNEVDIVRARLASTDGTLGRLHADSAIFDALASAQRELTLIMADIRRHPLRYVRF